MEDSDANFGFETLAIRAGHPLSNEQEHSEPIYPTSSFTFTNAAEAAARFAGDAPGNIYSRFTNPTVRNFEQRLAALEGGDRCVATASGMAAIFSTCFALLRAGDHVVCSRSVFSTIPVLLENFFGKFGVTTTFVELTDIGAWAAAIKPNTRLLFAETPSNPLCEVADVIELADLAHDHQALLVIDNCFCTPALQRPLALGADLVIHSATKYLDGQGRCVGGAVVGCDELLEQVFAFLRSGGPSMSPFNAWVFLKGLETLKLRMNAHCENAQALAEWLGGQDKIKHVFYAGLPEHPQHKLAARQQQGFGGVLSFCVASRVADDAGPDAFAQAEREAAWRFIDATQMVSITANLGDVKTTITHPASTTHGRLSAEQKAESGITENLVRVAVGLEDIEDIKADMQRGIAAL